MKSYNDLMEQNRLKAESLSNFVEEYGYAENLFRVQIIKAAIAIYTAISLILLPYGYLYEWYISHYLQNLDKHLVKKSINGRNGH